MREPASGESRPPRITFLGMGRAALEATSLHDRCLVPQAAPLANWREQLQMVVSNGPNPRPSRP